MQTNSIARVVRGSKSFYIPLTLMAPCNLLMEVFHIFNLALKEFQVGCFYLKFPTKKLLSVLVKLQLSTLSLSIF